MKINSIQIKHFHYLCILMTLKNSWLDLDRTQTCSPEPSNKRKTRKDCRANTIGGCNADVQDVYKMKHIILVYELI